MFFRNSPRVFEVSLDYDAILFHVSLRTVNFIESFKFTLIDLSLKITHFVQHLHRAREWKLKMIQSKFLSFENCFIESVHIYRRGRKCSQVLLKKISKFSEPTIEIFWPKRKYPNFSKGRFWGY